MSEAVRQREGDYKTYKRGPDVQPGYKIHGAGPQWQTTRCDFFFFLMSIKLDEEAD